MSNTDHHIVVTEPYESWAVDRLREAGTVTILPACDEATLLHAVSTADALLIRTYSQISAQVIAHAPQLRVIGRAGVGVENIDLVAAAERGIVVVSTPDASTDAVADLTLGLLIALTRGIVTADAATRAGKFHQARKSNAEQEMHQLTVGILGMGRIGRAVGQRCRNGFGMRVIYHDVVDPGWLPFAAEQVTLDGLIQTSDVLTLHVPLTAQTRGLVNQAAMRRMKKSAYLINTCRGAVVDNLALAECLHCGNLAGAALDVTEPEPLPMDHPLMSAPGTILTPHVGAKTAAAHRRMNEVIEDVIRVLQGRQPINPCGNVPERA